MFPSTAQAHSMQLRCAYYNVVKGGPDWSWLACHSQVAYFYTWIVFLTSFFYKETALDLEYLHACQTGLRGSAVVLTPPPKLEKLFYDKYLSRHTDK